MRWHVVCANLFFLSFHTVFAAGDGHASISGLIYPSVNFLIFASILVIKLRSPLSSYFKNLSEETLKVYQEAEQEEKDSVLKYQLMQQKLDQVHAETKQVLSKSERDLQEYDRQFKKELDQRLDRMRDDARLMMEYERNQKFQKLNEELVQEIVNKAKGKISGHKDRLGRVTQNLLGSI